MSPSRRTPNAPTHDIRQLKAMFPVPEGTGNAFDNFRSNNLAELILRYANRVEKVDEMWKPLGVYSWSYAPDTYQGHVTYRYYLDTPALKGEVLFVVQSEKVETPTGPRRDWFLNFGNEGCRLLSAELTPYGDQLRRMQTEMLTGLAGLVSHIAHDRRAEAEKMLHPNANASTKRQFDDLYASLRRDAKPTETAAMSLLTPIVLRDTQNGEEWQITFRGIISAGVRDVEYEVTLQAMNPDKEKVGSRIISCRFGGERKRQDPAKMMGMPGMPE
jgi:hypothetical protein